MALWPTRSPTWRSSTAAVWGYACRTTAYTLSALNIGDKAKLYTHVNVKEDAFDIYGFATTEELHLFQQLIGVSGVGPKAGLAILSATRPLIWP